MNRINKSILFLTAIIIILGGCSVEFSEDVVPKKIVKEKSPKLPKPVAADTSKRFVKQTITENKLEDDRSWAKKNNELSNKNKLLEKLNAELTADNERLVKRFNAMKTNLEMTEKELSDANEMLIEMRKELDGWKTKVVGYQERNDFVHKEQLKALVKILKLLGAEHIEEE